MAPTSKRTFVIGDVHGHNPELIELLLKANIEPGQEDVEIVQLGDLGHFGEDSTERDYLCYGIAQAWGMKVLWGNHDMACLMPDVHGFRGFKMPPSATLALMAQVAPKFAHAAHGFLITHAGLHPKFLVRGETVESLADRLNVSFGSHVINAIGRARGGFHNEGGILWRDDREGLARIPQVYGHTRGLVRENQNRWRIDVAEKGDVTNLVGLWLPECKLVAVGPDASMYDRPGED